MLRLETTSATTIAMTKFFSAAATEEAKEIIGDKKRVLFIDTPATPHLVELVADLVGRGVEVVVRDHHDAPNPRNPREEEVHAAAEQLRDLVGDDSVISDRTSHPACSSLIEVGEFGDFDVIIADPDPDGLLASMKALGIVYPELDRDASILDGPRVEQTSENLSELALLLVKGMATLPPFNLKNPAVAEKAKGDLFSLFIYKSWDSKTPHFSANSV